MNSNNSTNNANELHSVKTDVAILKKDVSNIQGLLGRLDTAIDKIADATNGISKILTVHESELKIMQAAGNEVRRVAEKETDLLHKRISDMKDEGTAIRKINHDCVMAKLDKMQEMTNEELTTLAKRVMILERWKWLIMGGSTALGFVVATIIQSGVILGP